MKLTALRPVRLRQATPEEQKTVTWLELFYDLVFVVAVANLGKRLLGDPSWSGVLSYVGLFFPLWWAWASFTFYADRYDTDDLGQRILAVAQMVAIALMAASMAGETDSTAAYAAAYVLARIVLLAMYWRAYRHVPESRELVGGYLRGFSVGAAIWVTSIWVPEPLRFYLWAIAIVVDLVSVYRIRKIQASVPLNVSHLPERFGLFTILVLGESIAAVVVGMSEHAWDARFTTAGVLGVAAASGMWWLYFDNLEGSVVRRRPEQRTAWKPTAWIYAHLPLAVALTAFGIGLEFIVADHLGTSERWLVVGAGVVALLAMALIHIATERGDVYRDRRQAAVRILGALVFLIVGLISASWSANAMLAVLLVIIWAQVGVDVRVYAERH